MTGHIRRRGKQSWELKFDLGVDPVTSKRRIRYTSFKGTRRDAQLELARLVAQNAAGEGVDPSRVTVAEFMQRWDRDWATGNIASLKTWSVIARSSGSTSCRTLGQSGFRNFARCT
jgi:hypothetical protein